jgi:hypothetical protein
LHGVGVRERHKAKTGCSDQLVKSVVETPWLLASMAMTRIWVMAPRKASRTGVA